MSSRSRLSPSLTIGEESFIVGDDLRFRLSPDDPWQSGHVLALRVPEGALRVQPADNTPPLWLQPGPLGQVQKLHGAALVAELEGMATGPKAPPPKRWGLQRKTRLQRKTPLRAKCPPPRQSPPKADHAFAPSAFLPLVRVVTTGSAGRAVPKPKGPVRDPAFLAFVREHGCCACPAPAPSEAHHEGPRGISQKTDDPRGLPLCERCHRHRTQKGRLPGRTRAESTLFMLQVQVRLLVAWSARLRAETAAEAEQVVVVRILGLVA